MSLDFLCSFIQISFMQRQKNSVNSMGGHHYSKVFSTKAFEKLYHSLKTKKNLKKKIKLLLYVASYYITFVR